VHWRVADGRDGSELLSSAAADCHRGRQASDEVGWSTFIRR
jgi:hypothetical protein